MTSQKNNSEQSALAGSLRAGVVLCGGKSSRMGRSKADLEFGNETMLHRVVRLLSQVVNHIVVVAAEDQDVGSLDSNKLQCTVSIARDQLEFAGPLAGIGVGLEAVQKLSQASALDEFAAAYITSCDVPFLNPGFVETLFEQLENDDIVVPFDDKHLHPISAVYRPSVANHIRELLEKGERRPRTLFDILPTRRIPTTSLRDVDPGLLTLLNLNSPTEYKAALEQANLPIPDWVLEAE